MRGLIGSLLIFSCFALFAQNGTLKGQVIDEDIKEPLIGAYVRIIGTYGATITDENGKFEIKNIKPGDYNINVTFMGYQERVYSGIKLKANETTTLNVKLTPRTSTFQEVAIIGEKKIVNLDDAESRVTIRRKDIAEMNVRDVTEVVALQSGVSRSADGIQIRGARVYETSYNIDNVSAQDPLAGTGFGVQVGAGSIGQLEVLTGGVGAEHGEGTAGVISTIIREGTDKFEISGNWQRDNLGFFKPDYSWNTDIFELNMGGKFYIAKRKFNFFVAGTGMFSDDYFGPTANQLYSSLMENDPFWSPRQTNQFTNTIKLSHELDRKTKLTLTNQHSLSINQNTRSLQIVGFDAILAPGFQYERSLNLDNATTYTHRSNLTVLNLQRTLSSNWVGIFTAGRLFTNLRADANGRPFRTETVDENYDEQSIVTDPVKIFNPDGSVRFVLPGPGLVNNNGISPVWHDHYASEYTLKLSFKYYPANKIHQYNYGWEQKFNEYQWVDVTKPWIGAPIKISDDVTLPSISIGSSNDIWKVRPNNGGFFFSDKINYKGIIANLGMRFNYWAPGRFVDDAVADQSAPVIDQVREDYQKNTIRLGLRYKARFLPKLNVSFPVTTNNVLYFNYGHAMRLPHPRFVYAGLDPVYQDRSFLSFLGNPDLNPEINVSYEVGYKSQINKDLGITLSAYNNNRFDYIISRRVIVRDQTGRPVSKTMFINQDYAKVQGAEFNLNYRIKGWFRTFGNVSYQVARGKSNTARESSLQIEQTGEVPLSSEQYLAWDRPWNVNLGVVISADTTLSWYRKWQKGMQLFISSTYQSGFRYTPMIYEGDNPLGRPEFRVDINNFLEERATPWYNTDIKLTKTIRLAKEKGLTLGIEVRNLLNNKNAQIVNPVTGTAYRDGDNVPNNWRDPKFVSPEERGTPPMDPARWLPPRQTMFSLSFKF
jgi:outer membrane receptor protein involved in Fe transport